MKESKGIPDKLLIALCSSWDDRRTGLLILEAHLKDEIERAGCSLDEIQPQITGEVRNPALDSDIAAIQSYLSKDNDFRSFIAMTADSVRKLEVNSKMEFTPKEAISLNESAQQTMKEQPGASQKAQEMIEKAKAARKKTAKRAG